MRRVTANFYCKMVMRLECITTWRMMRQEHSQLIIMATFSGMIWKISCCLVIFVFETMFFGPKMQEKLNNWCYHLFELIFFIYFHILYILISMYCFVPDRIKFLFISAIQGKMGFWTKTNPVPVLFNTKLRCVFMHLWLKNMLWTMGSMEFYIRKILFGFY